MRINQHEHCKKQHCIDQKYAELNSLNPSLPQTLFPSKSLGVKISEQVLSCLIKKLNLAGKYRSSDHKITLQLMMYFLTI